MNWLKMSSDTHIYTVIQRKIYTIGKEQKTVMYYNKETMKGDIN